MKMRLFAANTVVSLAAFTAACASMPGAGNSGSASSGSDSGQLLSVDHYVRVKSTAPAMNGQIAQVYVRERVVSRNILRGGNGVVLFVHGAGTPADPDTVDRDAHPADEAPVRAFIRTRLPVADGPVRASKICLYTVTPDEHFIVDVEGPVAYASACSGHGFKFASVMGEVLADLALEGTTRHPIGFLSAARFAAART